MELKNENQEMKSELRKWNTHPGNRLQQAKQQYKESGQSLGAAKVYIYGLAHSLKHMERQNEKLVEALERSIEIIKKCTCMEINYIDLWKILKEAKGE